MMKSKVMMIVLVGAILIIAAFAYGGVYQVRGVGGSPVCYVVNRFTGKTWFVTPNERRVIKEEEIAVKPKQSPIRFKTQKYRDGIRKVFDQGYTVDEIAAARPNWSPEAVQKEYDLRTKEEPARFNDGKYRRKIRAALDAGYTLDEVIAAKPNWSREAIQHEYDLWKSDR